VGLTVNYENELIKLINKKDIVTTSEVENEGIPRKYLTDLVRKNLIIRIKHGVYISKDIEEDRMYILQKSYSKAIFSHETALFVHDLIDRDPLKYTVTVPTGYNATNLKVQGLDVYFIKRAIHMLGVEQGETIYGREILIYDKERTICDIIRNRSTIDADILKVSLKNYISDKEKNIPKLIRYSKKLRVEKILRSYMEMLI